ncbi:MAG: putative DNA binding domain-containing protein [Solobacterium sp.]|nr:putative DNA binding domain-containing protein [Solobacterium sp.]
MAIPITIDTLLNENVVEWARIEFKEGWNPETTLKTIAAFANDIDNWGGGYIVLGAEEKDGELVKPIRGLDSSEIDGIQKELLRYCKFLRPAYVPQSQPVKYEGKHLLLIWCPGGYERPYLCPKRPLDKKSDKVYYIRKLSSTIEATDADRKELLGLMNNIPFDDRVNLSAELKDLKYPLIQNYLEEVNSDLLKNDDRNTLEKLAKNLRIAYGPSEYFKPLNVGLLFFSDDPERFFPYSRIELVDIPDPTGQGMTERFFRGPLDQQLKGALTYIRNNVIAEKIFKVDGQAEAVRVFNYSYEAIEEFVSNAVYHKSYQIHEPVTIRIEKEKIEITSIPGPDRSISDADIRNYTMRSRRYRNRRIGDFLKELHLVEGRNTGIPRALRKIRENGSPLPLLVTDEDRSFFSVILPIHEQFRNSGEEPKKQKKRRSREEIRHLIIIALRQKPQSMTELYASLGYRGNPSGSFVSCVKELIDEGAVTYTEAEKHSPMNLLILK